MKFYYVGKEICKAGKNKMKQKLHINKIRTNKRTF